MDKEHDITTVAELEEVIGEPLDFIRAKVLTSLDDVMQEFIGRSPLAFVSTVDANGLVDVSPKGDPAGFIHIDGSGALLIPERSGNKLTFGFRNILRNGKVGLIFLVPNQRETLRVKGVATLHKDPETLERLQALGKPALMYARVEVKECFFHCGKALIRSKLWQPDAWGEAGRSLGARQFSKLLGSDSEETVRQTEALLEQSYKDQLY